MTPFVLGIDGCRTGWLTCRLELATQKLGFHIFRSFTEILTFYEDVKFVGVDVPIGLRDDGQPRKCDLEARRLLAPERSSCVFPAPQRRLLDSSSYREACERSDRWFGKKISRQAFAIFPKVMDVDKLITRKIQERVFEVHPELCFWRINGGQALRNSKKGREGFEERRLLLMEACRFSLPDSWHWLSLLPHRPAGANRDDLLDAAVAAHVARCRFEGTAKALPEAPELDNKGIRMEMIY